MKPFKILRIKALFTSTIIALFLIHCEDPDMARPVTDAIESEVPVAIESPKLNYVKGSNIPNIVGAIAKKTNTTINQKGGRIGKISYNNTDIHLNNAIEVINADGKVNYTFDVYPDKAKDNEFYSLVVEKYPDGSLGTPIVVGYFMKKKDIDRYIAHDMDFKHFKAEQRFFEFDRFFTDSAHGRVGKTTDCGGGTIGSSGGTGYTSPGSTFDHSFNGTTVSATFGFQENLVTYSYDITIEDVNSGVQSTSTTSSLSNTFSLTNHSFNAPAQVVQIPPATVSYGVVTYTAPTAGSGTSSPCVITISLQAMPDGGAVTTISDPCSTDTPTQKGFVSSKSDDCTVVSGGVAINVTLLASRINNTLGRVLNDDQLWHLSRYKAHAIYVEKFLENNISSKDKIDAIAVIDAMTKGIEIPPSCKSFDYQQGVGNTQTAAVKNISFRVRYTDLAGVDHASDVVFNQPIYFTIPRFHSTEGNLTNGRGAKLSARALLSAHSRATAYFLATNASESQVRAKLWEYIRDEFRNGSHITGGYASFDPPLEGFNGPIKNYVTSLWFEDNCD